MTVGGAAFAAALFDTTAEDASDRQPVLDGPFLLACDARIDNREELLQALQNARIGVKSADSDILLAGWTRWKHGLFERVVGSYALAVFDVENQTVILARGPSGDRPLCYRADPGMLRFASMPSGLFDDGFSPDLPALARSIVHGDMALGETAFADVQAVPPAHFLEWKSERHQLKRFWQPPAVDNGKAGDAKEEFRDKLAQSVQSRLRRVDGPVATHLSSGLDSSAVTATAAMLIRDRHDLIAFTMVPASGLPLSVPRQYRADESALAAETARQFGIEQKFVSHSGPLLECLRGHGRIYQAPVPNVLNHGWGQAIDERAAASGAKVLLSATQGNATLSYGWPRVLEEWLKRGHILEYLRQIRGLVRNGRARWRGLMLYSIVDSFPVIVADRLLGRLPRTAAELFIRDEWKRSVEGDEIGSSYRASGLRQDQYDMYAHTDPGLFVKGTLAKNGLDERDPGADQRLIDFCLALPAEHYVHDGTTRRLAREGLADRLPRSIIENYVRGYQGSDWFAKLEPGSALDWIEDIEASGFAGDILDLAALRAAIARWDEISGHPPDKLRQWGNSFTRALAVGAFLREAERDFREIGRAR